MRIIQPTLFLEIENLIKRLEPEIISDERKAILKPLTDFIQSKVSSHQEIRINF
ncbi:MAG: arsenate reductase, partial [Maribacter sp.]